MNLMEAINYLVQLGVEKKPTEKLEYGGRHYTNKEIKRVEEPLVKAIQVSTLSGLCDLIGTQFEGFDADKHLVHVLAHDRVYVTTKKSNHWKDRDVLIDCSPEEIQGFPFGKFISPEEFTIGLQSRFVPNDDREKVLKISSNVTGEAVVTSTDDGISQQLGVKRGVTLQGHETVRSVKLAPYRTFREVEQPTSEFILRARQQGEQAIPILALFEADGGLWKIHATENIARHLRVHLNEKITIVS